MAAGRGAADAAGRLTERTLSSVIRIVVAPLTRTVRGIPSELPLGPDDGVPERCVASFDNLATIDRRGFVERICTLPPSRMPDVCRALRIAVDC